MYWVVTGDSRAENIREGPIEVAGEIIQAQSLVFAAVLIWP